MYKVDLIVRWKDRANKAECSTSDNQEEAGVLARGQIDKLEWEDPQGRRQI